MYFKVLIVRSWLQRSGQSKKRTLIRVFNKTLKKRFIRLLTKQPAALPQKNEVNTFLIAVRQCAAMRHNKMI